MNCGLPPQLSVSFLISHLNTANPLEESITGVARTRKEDPAEFLDEGEGEGKGKECRCFENLYRWLTGLKKLTCKSDKHHDLPPLEPVVYEVEPSARVEIKGVRIPAYGTVTAAILVRNTGKLNPGSQYQFQVQQVVNGQVIGGSTFVVQIAGTPQSNPPLFSESLDITKRTHEKQFEGETGVDLKYVPPWAKQMVSDREKLLKKSGGS